MDYTNDMPYTNVSAQYPNSTLVFTVVIQIVDDDMIELTERFIVTLQLLTSVTVANNSNLMATIVILDNEGR